MKELVISILDTSRERLKNPLLGSFIVAWIICNWKAISIYFFGNQEILEKLKLINNDYSKISNALVYPLIVAIIYSVSIPYILSVFDLLIFKGVKLRKRRQTASKRVDWDNKIEIAEKEIQYEEIRSKAKTLSETNEWIVLPLYSII